LIEVTLNECMGDDLTVANAARVSFRKKSSYMPRVHMGEPKVLRHEDRKLIVFLAKEKHISPFGHCFVSFHVKAPVFVARQLVKHSFLRWNEVSRRYVDDAPEFYVPEVWRGRSADKKQGSEGEVKTNANVEYHNQLMADLYKQQLDEGVCPEQARMHLPQSMMTEWYWSGSLDAFARMCSLRCKPDTQYESRLVADQINDEMMRLYPVSWEALRMYEE
jgi:thymidylate synthase (FAD)